MSDLLDDSYILETLQNVNQRKNTEEKYKDMLLDRLIEEITFLKDEIIFLREDIKRKSDETTFLLNLLGVQENNKNIKKLYRLPSTSALNNENTSLNSTKHTNELNAVSDKRNSKIHMNIPINHNLSSNDRLSKSSEYVISDVHNQFNTATLNERILVDDSLFQSNESLFIQSVNMIDDCVHTPITQQMKQVREKEHKRFMDAASKGKNDENINIINDENLWPERTLCIMGDSIVNGLDGRRLDRNGIKVKVRCFPGASISDMHDYCRPIIKKKPSYIILHVGTNDANEYSSREILNKLLNIKSFIESELPTCKIIISTPTYRNDNAKCGLTIKHLCDHILNLNLDIVDNTNICGVHLGKRGLHMNGKGTGRLAMNIISCMQGL